MRPRRSPSGGCASTAAQPGPDHRRELLVTNWRTPTTPPVQADRTPEGLRAAEDLPKLPDLVPLERFDRLRLLRRVVRGVVRLEPAIAVILDSGRVQAPFLGGDAGGNEVEVAAVAGERRHGLVQQAVGLLIRLLRVE